jgi:ABC-2 type transport system ATP-binding protein
MEEAQELSDHIAIVDHGKMIACGTHEELVKLVGGQTRIDLTVNVEPDKVLDAWRSVEGVKRVFVEEEQISVLVDDSNLAAAATNLAHLIRPDHFGDIRSQPCAVFCI